jgi:hypothetical protein
MNLEFEDYLRLGLYLRYSAERDFFVRNVYKRIARSR